MLLGKILIRDGICKVDDIRTAHSEQMRGDNRMIGEILVDLGIIDKRELRTALIKQRKTMIAARKLLLSNRMRVNKIMYGNL